MAHASFSTLPLELKAKIVEMVSGQEDAYKERVLKAERAGHINCLSALALVTKELRDLTAKHQFRVLSANRAALPVFRFTILPLYGHHINEVTFYNEDSVDGSELVLSAMAQFPALNTLRLEQAKALELFGSFQTPNPIDEVATYRARTLALFASIITTLVLFDFDAAEAGAVVRRFPNISTLGLIAPEPSNAVESTELFGAIASARRLSNLAISAADDFGSGWPPEAFVPLEHDPPPLRTLQLNSFPFNGHTFSLIGAFASTLEALSLRAAESEQHQPLHLASTTPLHLPNLTHLNLATPQSKDIQFIRLITSASTLSYLSLIHGDFCVDLTDPALLSFLDSQPSLRLAHLESLRVSYPFAQPRGIPPVDSSYLATYADLVRSRGLDPSVLDKPHLSPFHPRANLEYTENDGAYLAEVLDRTLDFGRSELKRMVAEGRAASAVEWVAMLKPLEDKRLAWKD